MVEAEASDGGGVGRSLNWAGGGMSMVGRLGWGTRVVRTRGQVCWEVRGKGISRDAFSVVQKSI